MLILLLTTEDLNAADRLTLLYRKYNGLLYVVSFRMNDCSIILKENGKRSKRLLLLYFYTMKKKRSMIMHAA